MATPVPYHRVSGNSGAWDGFRGFRFSFSGEVVSNITRVSQSAVYLSAHCHLDQIIVDVAVYDRALCQFEALSSMDIALDLAVNHGVGDFDFTRYFSALDNPQDGVLSGLGCNKTRYLTFNVQIATECDRVKRMTQSERLSHRRDRETQLLTRFALSYQAG